MVIVVQTGNDKLGKLKDLVESKVGCDVRRSLVRNSKILMMKGIDALTTTRELEDAISVALDEDGAGKIEIQPLRNTVAGDKSAVIKITPDIAFAILESA